MLILPAVSEKDQRETQGPVGQVFQPVLRAKGIGVSTWRLVSLQDRLGNLSYFFSAGFASAGFLSSAFFVSAFGLKSASISSSLSDSLPSVVSMTRAV
jgi:hypothetical protein